jgi:hypothetical protein
MLKHMYICVILLAIAFPIQLEWAQADTPNWTVQVLQASRSEDVECFYDDPDLTRIERYGSEGTKWVRVTVAVTRPASSNRLSVNQINLSGRPLLAVAYTAKPTHCAAFKFISAFDTPPEECKKHEKRLPKNCGLVPADAIVSRAPSAKYYAISPDIFVKNFNAETEVSGVWVAFWREIEKDKDKRKAEITVAIPRTRLYTVIPYPFEDDRVVSYIEGAAVGNEILRIIREKDTNEIAVEFPKKGLFGTRRSTKIILLFTAPAGAKDLQLTFGDAVLPVQLMD